MSDAIEESPGVKASTFAARHTCDSPEWYTPAPIVEAARLVLGGIDLDPASHAEANAIVKAERYYTEADNGLILPWFGTVFLNPPGGQVAEFWRKAIDEYERKTFHHLIYVGYSLEQLQTLQQAGAKYTPLNFTTCFTRKRIAFVENEAKKTARLAKIDQENEQRRSRGEKLKSRNEDGGSPSHSNFITYIGPYSSDFARAFAPFGEVIVRLDGLGR